MRRRSSVGILVGLMSLVLAEGLRAQETVPYAGFAPAGLAFDGESLYVAEVSRPQTIFRLDRRTGAILGSFLAPSPGGFDGSGNTSDIVCDGNGSLFVTDLGEGSTGIVYEIDTAGTTIRSSFPIPFRGGAIAFDGTNLHVGDFDSDEILVVDRSGRTVRSYFGWVRPAGMVFDPGSGHLWVVSEFDRDVTEMTVEGEIVRTCAGPRDPGPQGLGGVTLVGPDLYIGQCLDPDAGTPPDIPGTIFVVTPSSMPCTPPGVLNVPIDILPGRHPNRVNPKSNAPIPVALLATATLATSEIDVRSIRFGRSGTEASVGRSGVADVDGDGDLDLLLLFRTRDTGIVCGDTKALLTGRTSAGVPFSGEDSIATIGCKPKRD